jgi:hypothetical protein
MGMAHRAWGMGHGAWEELNEVPNPQSLFPIP